MNAKLQFIFIHALLLLVLLTPVTAFALDPIVPCTGEIGDECGFPEFIKLVHNIIYFFITIAATLAAIAFTYAGFMYLTAGGDEGKVKKAHGIFINVLIGFIIAASAWLVVKLLLSFVDQGQNFTLPE